MELVKEMHPGLFIHSVYLEEEQDADRKAGFVRALCSVSLPLYA